MKIDHTGNAAYAAQFEYFTALKIIAAVSVVLLAASITLNLKLIHRAPEVRVVRLEDSGRTDVLDVRATDYTPMEREIKSWVSAWATDRYRLVKAVMDDNFATNYYFLDPALTAKLTAADTDTQVKIEAGTYPEQDVEIKSIRFRNFDTRHLSDGTVGSGECVVDLVKTYNVSGPDAKERWTVTLRYVVNPMYALNQKERYQRVNPLGFTITWFHEDRAVD